MYDNVKLLMSLLISIHKFICTNEYPALHYISNMYNVNQSMNLNYLISAILGKEYLHMCYYEAISRTTAGSVYNT